MSDPERIGTVRCGDELIGYEIVQRPGRKTLGIEVHPDGRVLTLVPTDGLTELVEQEMRLRSGWISRQLALFSRCECGAAQPHHLSCSTAHRATRDE